MAEVELVNEEELNYGQDIVEDEVTKTVTAKLNVREKPSTDAKILCVLEVGTEVKVLEEIDGWTHHDKGWSMTQYLK